MNLFIDTNVWLSFFHFTKDDLEELRKVAATVRTGRLALLLPAQVEDEFWRNREGKLKEALKDLRDAELPTAFPQICKAYPEYSPLRTSLRDYGKLRSQLLASLEADIQAQTLAADDVVKELFEIAEKIPVTDEILAAARRRYDLGNPPGKKKSTLGDEANWECLLAAAPDDEDLHIVAVDADWASKADPTTLAPFLETEWQNTKRSQVQLYSRLSAFFKEHFPEVKLATELEKEILIQDLSESGSFRQTKQTLRRLVRFSDFSEEQVNDIALAATTNNQIYWIAEDGVVRRSLRKLTKGHEDWISPETLPDFLRVLGRSEEADDLEKQAGD